MSESVSASTRKKYGLERVCHIWRFPRSTVYATRQRRQRFEVKKRPGPKPSLSDEELTSKIRKVIKKSKFTGEGHRKVRVRLRRIHGIRVSFTRVLRLMRKNKLLSPHRSPQGKAKTHNGRITTDVPNELWGADATKIMTVEDGWVNFLGVLDHWNSECLGWHLCKKGDRHAAIEALRNAVRNSFGQIEQGIARGVTLRPDHGSLFTAEDYRREVKYYGFHLSYSFVKEPETNGVIERFHRSFKEQIIHGREYQNIEELREVVAEFIKNYNSDWLLQKLGYRSPTEARQAWRQSHAA